MTADPRDTIDLREGRFARLEAIPWWDRDVLVSAKVLVIGAGALGNEVIKNLSLLGVGRLVVVDMDRIEESNLCRSVLFRESDAGEAKAEIAVRAARNIYPRLQTTAIVGNVLADVGLGVFRWSDVVVGAVDNREARLFINASCARVGRPWIDGGIEALNGVVRGFAPPATTCYECTLSEADWKLIDQRRSCSLLARHAVSQSGEPTTPTTASVIGAIQAQEVVKRLHGLAALDGTAYFFEGLHHNSYTVEYPRSPSCPWHETQPPIEAPPELDYRTPLRDVWSWAADRLEGLDAIDLSRELVERFHCVQCGSESEVFASIEHGPVEAARCDKCGAERVPRFLHSVANDRPDLLGHSAAELGLPPRDILWCRRGDEALGIELAVAPSDDPLRELGASS